MTRFETLYVPQRIYLPFYVYLLIFSQHHLWSSWQPFTWHHLVQKRSKLGVGSHQIYSCRKIFSRHRHFGCFWCWHLYMHVWLFFFMLDPNIYCLNLEKHFHGKILSNMQKFPSFLFQGQKSFWKCHSQLYAGGHSSQSPNLTWPSGNSDWNKSSKHQPPCWSIWWTNLYSEVTWQTSHQVAERGQRRFRNDLGGR